MKVLVHSSCIIDIAEVELLHRNCSIFAFVVTTTLLPPKRSDYYPNLSGFSEIDSLGFILKGFDQASNCLQIPVQKSKGEAGSTKSEDKIFAHEYKTYYEHSDRQKYLSFCFGINKSCVFFIKIFNNTIINSYLQKL